MPNVDIRHVSVTDVSKDVDIILNREPVIPFINYIRNGKDCTRLFY